MPLKSDFKKIFPQCLLSVCSEMGFFSLCKAERKIWESQLIEAQKVLKSANWKKFSK
jgi:hypothetical protein